MNLYLLNFICQIKEDMSSRKKNAVINKLKQEIK